jgi:hypothetical protein
LAPASALLESGWRQGTVLPRELVPEGVLPSSIGTDAKLLIISHDCDLVNPSYELEPFLEFLVMRPRTAEARDGRLFNRKNPRRLQFEAEDLGTPSAFMKSTFTKSTAWIGRFLKTDRQTPQPRLRQLTYG